MIDSGGYVKGDRVRFLTFGEPDPHSRLTAGTEGTVVHVDDLGTVHVQWDDGGRLGMIVDPPAGQPPDRIEPAASTARSPPATSGACATPCARASWLRTQWIARVAFDLGRAPWHPDHQRRIWRALSYLYVEDEIKRRSAQEWKHGEVGGVEITFPVPRWEWRLPHNTMPTDSGQIDPLDDPGGATCQEGSLGQRPRVGRSALARAPGGDGAAPP